MPNNIGISHSVSGLITNQFIASDLPDNIQTVTNVEFTNLNNACELNNDNVRKCVYKIILYTVNIDV